MKKVAFVGLSCVALFAYEPGSGIELGEYLKVGGYIALEYEKSKNTDSFLVDDVALMAYGNFSPTTRYLVEMENVGRYQKDFKNDKENEVGTFRVERATLEHNFSSYANLVAGKMITPIGYWNQTPINVLRDTTSSPLVTINIFPKLITGVQMYGDTGVDGLEYTASVQHTNDMDEKYNNFAINRFYGVGAKYDINDNSQAKLFAGYFNERNDASQRRFVHASYKYGSGSWQVLSEAAYSIMETTQKDTTSGGFFAQARYRVDAKNYAIARYEYYFDGHEQEREHIAIVGYNYRPIYPVSLKMEYGFSSIPEKSRFLCSISALF